MTYAGFAFYSETYGGRMTQADFEPAALLASSLIDSYTDGRAQRSREEFAEKLALACCAMADRLGCGRNVKHASNDGYSETYETERHGFGRSVYDIAAMYLNDTGLLYAGV